MRRYLIITTALLSVALVTTDAHSDFENLGGGTEVCPTFACGGGYHSLEDNVSNCSSKSYYCYYDFGYTVGIATCSLCNAGYTKTWVTGHIGDCGLTADDQAGGYTSDYRYTTCTCDNSSCANVGTWSNYNTKFQRRAKYTCQSGSCKATSNYEYRCAAGFYGASTNGTSGCSQCPAIDVNMSVKTYGTSVPGSNAAISSCFLAPGTYNDTTGTFKITGGNCNY